MINMMYLVLTALLALNVSKEILDSFVTVNTGLEITKQTLSTKMNETYDQFGKLAGENQEKYGQAYNAANLVKSSADSLFSYIDTIKAQVIAQTEKLPMDSVVMKDENGRPYLRPLDLVSGKDNYTVLTNFMGMGDPGMPKEVPYGAVELRGKLEAFRENLKAAATGNDVLIANFDRMFTFDGMKDSGGKPVSWEALNFYHVPLAAGVTILSKIQMDIRNAEAELVNWMMGEVEGQSFKFNKLTAIVKPQSSYVTVGGTYRAEIFLGAYDDQNVPEVYIAGPGAKVDFENKKIIGEAVKLPMEGTKAKLEQGAGGAGLRTVSGIIKFKPVGGEEQIEAFETTYEVAAPNVVVSPTKMNVFYRGVDNPVDISVAGYSAKDINASISNGTISKAANGYIVKPGAGNDATVNVTVTNIDGTKKAMPGVSFRVKRVPDPVPVFAGKGPADGTIGRSEMMAAQGVVARMEGFDFDLKFEVVEFTVVATIGGEVKDRNIKGNKMTPEAREMLQRVKNGQRIWIENVKAKGPDGTIRTLGTLALKVS
ncbi:MAG: gliding motility protein GldM [Flavobacteriales bacterium]|nr:gliding motility protein GldM [Flavobacteriales bacterium]